MANGNGSNAANGNLGKAATALIVTGIVGVVTLLVRLYGIPDVVEKHEARLSNLEHVVPAMQNDIEWIKEAAKRIEEKL